MATPATPSTQASSLAGPLVSLGRLFFALIFLMAGPNNFASQTIAYAKSQGVPLASLAVPLSGVIAIVGGLSILLGYRARLGAWLIALFLVEPEAVRPGDKRSEQELVVNRDDDGHGDDHPDHRGDAARGDRLGKV